MIFYNYNNYMNLNIFDINQKILFKNIKIIIINNNQYLVFQRLVFLYFKSFSNNDF